MGERDGKATDYERQVTSVVLDYLSFAVDRDNLLAMNLTLYCQYKGVQVKEAELSAIIGNVMLDLQLQR